MPYDPAAFRPEDVISIYGDRPRCVVTNQWQFVDLHHIVGRGYVHGAGKKSGDRKMFSSVFNCAPLQRDVHNSPRINQESFQHFLLDVVREIVMNAKMAGEYELQPADEDFLAFIDEQKNKEL